MIGINTDVHGFCVHALCATAATNALAYNAHIATIRLYDRRQSGLRRVQRL